MGKLVYMKNDQADQADAAVGRGCSAVNCRDVCLSLFLAAT